MSEIISERRKRAQQELGLDNADEQRQMDLAMQKEEDRRQKKLLRQAEIEMSSSYRSVQAIAKWMDKFFFDPIIGFLFPAIGDFLSTIFVVPFIYVSLVQVKSIPLTLAVISNVLLDMAVGMIPWLGNFVDIFFRAYVRNARLIMGFVEDDKDIINDVNRRAFWMAILIVVLCFVIYWLVKLAINAIEGTFNFISELFA